MNFENEVPVDNDKASVMSKIKSSITKVKQKNKNKFPYLKDTKDNANLNEEELIKKLSDNAYCFLYNNLENAILDCRNKNVK
jgi:hypothetical protein